MKFSALQNVASVFSLALFFIQPISFVVPNHKLHEAGITPEIILTSQLVSLAHTAMIAIVWHQVATKARVSIGNRSKLVEFRIALLWLYFIIKPKIDGLESK